MFAIYHYVVFCITWMLCCSYTITRINVLSDFVYQNVALLTVAAFIATLCRNRIELKCESIGRRSIISYLLIFTTVSGIIFTNGVIVMSPYVPLVAAAASIILVYAIALGSYIQMREKRLILVSIAIIICTLAGFIVWYLLEANSFSVTATVIVLSYQSYVMLKSQKRMKRMLENNQIHITSRNALCAFVFVSNIFLVYPSIYSLNEEN